MSLDMQSPSESKISSILLMLKNPEGRLRRRTRNNPRGRASGGSPQSPIDTISQQLSYALETLDNSHALMFLGSFQELSQQFLCLRTRLAHQLQEHSLCLHYARQALENLPSCKECLTVYLSHAKEIPVQDLPLSPKILLALEEANSDLQSLFPDLVPLGPQAELYSSLKAHLEDTGSQVSKIGIMSSSLGRRMIALERIEKNEQILLIPKEQLITLELSRSLPLVQKVLAAKIPLRSPKHTQLAIFLLHHLQMGPQSPFHLYLKTLPQDFSHFPINYPEELLKELKGTCFLEQIEHKKLDMKKDYLNIVAVEESFERFGLQKFCEARLLVSSRVFGIVMEGQKTDALVPMADMLNHRVPKQTSWFFCDRNNGFVIQSLRDIPSGHEVFDSYGQKCNSRFLLHYGFVLPNNPHNEASLDINLTHILQGSSRTIKIRVSRFLQSKGFQQMMGLLRATVNLDPQPEDESEEEITMGLEGLKQTPFKSKDNELKVWRMVEALVTSKLVQYPTSLLEDKRALQGCGDHNLTNVIILRRGEKEVLSFYQTMSKRMIRFLQSDGRRGDVSTYRPYIDSIVEQQQQ